jgi:uncharacterized protein YsxB (DUF464 family)
MENKTYTIQGQTFNLLPNDLNLLNKAAPMIAKLRKLSYDYTKDIDLSTANDYRARITELTHAKKQIEEIMAEGRDEHGNELSDEKKNEMQARINEISGKLEAITEEFKNDISLQNLLRLKEELESYALIELLTDIDFLKPILKKILIGGKVESLDFSDAGAIEFIRDVVTDFFTVMNRSSMKL